MQQSSRCEGAQAQARLQQTDEPLQYSSLPSGLAPSDAVVQSIRLRRAGSDWLCDSAKGFLRKVESRKTRRRKAQVTEGIIITRSEARDGYNERTLPMDYDANFLSQVEYPESPISDEPSSPKNKTCNGDVKEKTAKQFDNWQKMKMKSRTNPLASLSCGQLHMLRKLANIKLKTLLEKYYPVSRTGWNWEMPKIKKKFKHSDYKDKNVFGVPLIVSLQRTGQSLPYAICTAIDWLRDNALDQIGLFRKSGVRSRIQKLKLLAENDQLDFEEQQAYDVADMVKQYFRELPEVLLTNKLSEMLILIFQHVPIEHHVEAVKWVLLLLPDEHSEVLQILLELLHEVSEHSFVNQMTTSNLAVCLVPTLFHFRRTNPETIGTPSQQELSDNKAAHDCLQYLITKNTELFTISVDLVMQCHFSYLENPVPVTLSNLGASLNQDWREYQDTCINALLRAAREKNVSWVTVYNPYRPHIEIFYQKVGDGHPLQLWRVVAEVEAPPAEVMKRILNERHIWDQTFNVNASHVVAYLGSDSDIYQCISSFGGMKPLFQRDFCVLRSWKCLQKSACAIVETSIEHPDAKLTEGSVRGLILASRYLIEPCGSGKSRITHLSRMDIKGKSLEWYKSYGHICGLYLDKICISFKHNTLGPESKV